MRQPLGENANRLVDFGGTVRVAAPHPQRRVRDPERLLSGGVAQEPDDGAQLGPAQLVVDAHLCEANESGPLPAVIVDAQPPWQLAAHFQPVAARELRLRSRRLARCRSQDRAFAGDQSDGRQENDHLRAPMRFAPMKPLSEGGATITWILSESLSAIAFWMSRGFCAMSADSLAMFAVCALPVTSSL